MSVAGPSLCPGEDALERAVAGAGNGPIDEHVRGCPACTERARQIRENLAFMRELLASVEPGPADHGSAPASDALAGHRLVREIARGGQGTVYEGVQLETRRRVAIKLIEPGSGARAERTRRRIEREAEIAAGLRHPNIVTVYQCTGLPDGRYALTMEYVDGVTLDRWARDVDERAGADRAAQRQAVRTKLRAVACVCDAVQHAHGNGVIHRDLKPANVLVTADGVPRVVDFGVARRLAPDPTITRVGEFAGTLAYASPEQVSGDPEAVDIRSDVYSLGVMLYEVLAGRRPYETDRSLTGAIASITQTPPRPLGTLEPGAQPADGELEAVLAKALAKDPTDRYQTAGALKADLENYLEGRPLDAKRESALYVLRKTAARHRGAVSAAGAFLVLLAAFAVAMAWSAGRLDQQRRLLAASLASSNIERGRLLGLNGLDARAEDLIWPEFIATGADAAAPGLGFDSPPPVMQAAWALFELSSRHPSLVHAPARASTAAAVFEEDGRVIRTVGSDCSFERREVRGGRVIQTGPGLIPPGPGLVAFDRGARRAARVEADGVTMIDAATGERRTLSHPLLKDLFWAGFSDDGRRLLTTGKDGSLRLWSVEPLAPLAVLTTDGGRDTRGHFSADSRLVGSGDSHGARLWNTEDGSEAGDWPIPEDLWATAIRPFVRAVDLDARHERLAVAFSTWVLVYNARDPGAPPLRIQAHRGFVNSVSFSEDASVLLSTGSERGYRVWDPATGALLGSFEENAVFRNRPAMTRDGSLVGVCDARGDLHVWESHPRLWLNRLAGPGHSVHSVRFSPDGRLVAAVCSDGSLHVWRRADAEPAWSTPPGGDPLTALSFSPDGSSILTAGDSGAVTAYPAGGGAGRRLLQGPGMATWIGHSPDGRLVAVAGGSDIRLYDASSGASAGTLSGHSARAVEGAFSPDGRSLASAGGDGVCIVWDLAGLSARLRLEGHTNQVRAVCYSPDGATIATGSDDFTIRLWDARTGRCTRVLLDARQHIFGLAFHPGGNLLFSCCRDPALQVWDARTGRELAALDGHEGLVLSLDLSPDGRTLATASADHTVGLWDLAYYQTHIRGCVGAWTNTGRAR